MSRWKSFQAGFRATRFTSLLAALTLTAGILSSIEGSLRQFAFSRLPQKNILIWTHDLWSYIPHRLGWLAQHPTDKERIFLIGSSALYHSHYGTPGLQQTMQKLGHPSPPEIVLLHTPTQSMGESLQIADNLPPGHGTVVISTTPTRFRSGPEQLAKDAAASHLLLASPTLARFLEARGIPGWRYRLLLPAFVNYLRLYLPMNRRHLEAGQLPAWNLFTQKDSPRQLSRLADWNPSSSETSAPRFPLKSEGLRYHLVERRQENQIQMELLALTVQTVRSKGYRPVLLETPLHPDFQKKYPEKVAVLRAQIEAMAATENIPYWDLAWKLKLEGADFMDTVHLKEGSPGRGLYHAALAAALFRQVGGGGPAVERKDTP